jgi:hypothetical protein
MNFAGGIRKHRMTGGMLMQAGPGLAIYQLLRLALEKK